MNHTSMSNEAEKCEYVIIGDGLLESTLTFLLNINGHKTIQIKHKTKE